MRSLATAIAARALQLACLSIVLTAPAFGRAGDPVYEAKMISSGHNRPSIDLRRDDLIALCVALHERASLTRFRQAHDLSSSDLAERLRRLQGAGLIREWKRGLFLPTFMIVTASDARRYVPVADYVVASTTATINAKFAEIERHIMDLPGLGDAPSAPVNFFVLSDVLLDNWQIGAIEHDVLQAERPTRGGNAFYLALLERQSDQADEAFGIYGNTGTIRGNSEVNVYGRARYSGQTLISATTPDLRRWFPSITGLNDDEFEREIVARTIELGRAGSLDNLSADAREGFRHLGLLDGNRTNVLILPRRTIDSLESLAAIVRPDLVKLLKDHLPHLRTAYARSPYSAEVTFAEYAIWWYHFFYSKVTDSLATHGLLAVPTSGNVTYVVAS
jgi:hypothetical protein